MTRAIEVLRSDQCAARAEQFEREGLQSLNRAAIRARLEETDRNTVEIVCDVLRRLGAFMRQLFSSLAREWLKP